MIIGVFTSSTNSLLAVSLSKVTPDGGISYSQTICIAEDDLGFIWFGTNNGLFLYNSRSITKYHHQQDDENSIPTDRINNIHKDNKGKLWISTEKGLCSYNQKKDNFTQHKIKDQFGNYFGEDIGSFFQLPNGEYWISDKKSVAIFNPANNRVIIQNIANKLVEIHLIATDKNGTIWTFYLDGEIYCKPIASNTFYYFGKALPKAIRQVTINEKQIWIAYESQGVLCLNTDGSIRNHYKTQSSKHLAIPNNHARSITEDHKGQIWVGTYDGIALIRNDSVVQTITEANNFDLPNHSIWSLFEDSQNNMWIGTWMGGLCFYSEFNKSFYHYTRSTPVNSLSNNIVATFVQTPNTPNILIGTEGGSLNSYNSETNELKPLPVYYNNSYLENIKSLAYDKNETLWIGTYGKGVYYLEKGSKEYKKLKTPFASGLQALAITAIDEGLWVSSYNRGVYFYHFDSKTFKQYQNNPVDINSISDNDVRDIAEDKDGNMWFATQNGLNLLKKGSDQFIHYFHQANNNTSISSNYIYSIHTDKKGFLWMGTNSEGVDKFDISTGTCQHFLRGNDNFAYDIVSIIRVKDDLWFATGNGIIRFNPNTEEVKLYSNHSGIKNNQFNPNALLLSSDNELFFGGSNGMVRFSPKKDKIRATPPGIVITDLFIHNEIILPDTKDGILNNVISKTKQLNLQYWQNSISFKFATNNYINPHQTVFKYRMLGFNEEWTHVGLNALAKFTNIPAGSYTFEVTTANNDSILNNSPTQIQIRITPPLWKRWYAYLLYYLILILAILQFRKGTINRQKLKNEMEMSKIKSDSSEQLHQMKLQFFTNISHEFRTPLTLIEGPVNQLLDGANSPEEANKHLHLIKNNTQRLLRLINQFLDFRKIESSDLRLKPVNTDIIAFCHTVFSFFEDHAKQRAFSFNFKSELTKLNMDFDMDKLDKIIFNILSNAFKYSSDNGSITLEIQNNIKKSNDESKHTLSLGDDINGEFIGISITDTGKGIAKDNLEQVFERFYQVGNNSENGTGIGLSLTKNYILLHNGQLVVTSEEGKGSIFSIYIPKKQIGAITTQDVVHSKKLPITSQQIEPSPAYTSPSTVNDMPENQEALILIAEDNNELLEYLESVLQKHFRVAKAHNGKIAYDQTFSLFPDLVLSDIMMPEMDGIELCQKLKNDVRSSHIPVVLLTALDTIKDRISGMNSGADAYVPKPFNDELLIVQINNLLESRKYLRESYSTDDNSWETKYNSIDIDKKLLNNAIKLIEQNITMTDFSIEFMASNLNMSRTHLHRKLKSLTNQSATEFIRSIRLKNAIKLMKEGELKINEIGFAVGFNSHNYFSKSFKKHYGQVPSDYLHQLNKQISSKNNESKD